MEGLEVKELYKISSQVKTADAVNVTHTCCCWLLTRIKWRPGIDSWSSSFIDCCFSFLLKVFLLLQSCTTFTFSVNTCENATYSVYSWSDFRIIFNFFLRWTNTRIIGVFPEELVSSHPRYEHDGQFHMLITGRALICTEVVGNAITPDVSLVYTRVSVCIDIERYWLHQPPVSCLVMLAPLCVLRKRKSLSNHRNAALSWKWTACVCVCVYIKVRLQRTAEYLWKSPLSRLFNTLCVCTWGRVRVGVGIDHLFDLKASSEKISQVVNPFGGLH